MVSAATVAVGLIALLVMPVPFLRSIGVGSMLISLVAVTCAVTLLPVLLATWGPALDRHRLNVRSTTFSRRWERWGKLVIKRRWIAALTGATIGLGLAAPALSMNTGQPRANSLGGNGQAARTLRSLEHNLGVPSAAVFPIQLLTDDGAAATQQAATIAERTPGVYTVLAPATSSYRRGEESILSIIPTAEGNATTVTRLRSALAGVPGGVQVGGNTAQNIDFNQQIYGASH